MQVISRSATARSPWHLNLPLRRGGLEKPEQEYIETKTCQALAHMDTCYHNVLILVLCTIQYYYYVYFSTSTEYYLVLVLNGTQYFKKYSVQVINRRATARSPESLNLSLMCEGLEKQEQQKIETESCQALSSFHSCKEKITCTYTQ